MYTTTRVYRVEDPNGRGPYTSIYRHTLGRPKEDVYRIDRYISKNFFDITLHPSPYDEGLSITHDHYFGFSSLDQLKSWFGVAGSEGAEVLEEAGFKVEVYDVRSDYVTFGKRQLMFLKNRAVHIRSLNITSIIT